MNHITLMRAMFVISHVMQHNFPWWMWLYAILLELVWFAENNRIAIMQKLNVILAGQHLPKQDEKDHS
jgi:hypothetical protein